MLPLNNVDLMKKIWSLNIPPKVKIFGWLLTRQRLKTREGFIDLCQSEIESLKLKINYYVLDYPINDSLIFLIGFIISSLVTFVVKFPWAKFFWWQIWESMNNSTFKNVQPHPAKIFFSVAAIGSSYWKENTPHPQEKLINVMVIKW